MWAVKESEEARMIPKSLARSTVRVELPTKTGRTAGRLEGNEEQGGRERELTLDALV